MSQDTIQTFCRLRPIFNNDPSEYKISAGFDTSSIELLRPKKDAGYIDNSIEKFAFKFNGIFDTHVHQEQVFERCAKAYVLRFENCVNYSV